jgi:hypothetical protein
MRERANAFPCRRDGLPPQARNVVLARAIAIRARRAIDCADIAAELMESELFEGLDPDSHRKTD